MDDDRKQKWPAILFFTFSGIVFGISLYLVTAGATAAADTAGKATSTTATSLLALDEPPVEVVLERDQRIRLGDLELTYRGTRGQKLYLEVIIPELDPQYAYRHAIDLDTADRGFRLGGVALQLLSARQARAKILWNPKS